MRQSVLRNNLGKLLQGVRRGVVCRGVQALVQRHDLGNNRLVDSWEARHLVLGAAVYCSNGKVQSRG